MRFANSINLILAMALNLHGGTTTYTKKYTDADAFLAIHPEVLVGRDALSKARADFDDGNTFSVMHKPAPDMILIQTSDADTNDPLFVVALVNDSRGEEAYRVHDLDAANSEYVQTRCVGVGSEVDRADEDGPSQSLLESTSRCRRFCRASRQYNGDSQCFLCAFVGGL